MNRFAIVVVLLAGCSGKKSEGSKTEATKPTAAASSTACPMPKQPDIRERFAVGVQPHYRVEGMVHGAKCHDVFVANNVVKIEGDRPRIVAEGTFQGHCEGEPDNKRTFEAVKASKVIVAVNALAMNEGELGLGKPVVLDSKTPDKAASVKAQLVDRCGDQLSHGVDAGDATWTLGAGCETVAKLMPWDLDGPPRPNSPEMRFAPVGPGTCTVTVELQGVKGDVVVTVK